MAEKREKRSNARIECSVCLSELNTETEQAQPRLLTCGHSFCFGCLESSVTKGVIFCPVCRAKTHLGKPGVRGLKKDFDLLEVLNSLASNFQPPTPLSSRLNLCSECESATDTFCPQCHGTPVLCLSCFSAIHSTPKRKKHSLSKMTERQAVRCLEHNEERKLYCMQDNTLVCLMCAEYGGAHKGHSLEPIATAAKSLRAQVSEAQDQTNLKRGVVAESLVKLRQQEMELQIRQVQLDRMRARLQQCADESCDNIFLSHWEEVYWMDPSIFIANSAIMNGEDHWSLLKSWLPREFQKNSWFKLLYRGSRDGFAVEDFHERCDDKAPTLVVALTKKGMVVGGYGRLFCVGGFKFSTKDKFI
jgi:Zinc finger, C3HC4 type (RING finger)/B-box zinc finger